jgi:8-amino-7-oxononanoate synthase
MAFDYLTEELAARKQDGLLRARVCVTQSDARFIEVAGSRYLNFASNDYLGLAGESELINHSQFRCGSSSSALVTGYTEHHQTLEQLLCETLGFEAGLLCNSGFSANVGVIKALFKDPKIAADATVFQDKLNHASLIDGSLDAKAKLERFNHNDINHLRARLEKCKSTHKLIVTEGVFSMDGDTAHLFEIAELANLHKAWLMVDDAHAFGVIGGNGLGSVEFVRPEILVITFGKAVGGQGACILGSRTLIDYLLQFNREYIYSTSMSPVMAVLNLAQIKKLLLAHEARNTLKANIAYFRELALEAKLPLMDSQTAIQPIVLGDAEGTLKAQKKLKSDGIWLVAIRPPTVPFNTARLRITLTAKHTKEDIRSLVSALMSVV